MGWRLFQGFQQRIGCADGHPVGIVDQEDFLPADQRLVGDLMFQIADLLDFNLRIGQFRVRFDRKKVRVRAGFDLHARPARAARITSVARLAIDGLREAQGEQLFPDSLVAVEEIRVGDAIVTERGL